MSLSSDGTVMTMPVQPAYQGNGNGSMWGGDWSSWIILFLIFGLFGGWGNGFGGFGGGNGVNGSGFQGYATRADINEGFALNGLQTGQSGILSAVTNGFHGVDSAICNLGYQLQDCCCQTQRAVDGVNYNLATHAAANQNAIQGLRYDMATQDCETRNTIHNSTRDIIDNQNANSRAILDFLTQDKIATLQAENQSLKLAASQSNQNAVLMAAMDANKAEILRRTGSECPVPAYWVQPPTPVQVPCNPCNPCGGCGC